MCRSSSKIVLKRCRHFPLGCVWNFTPRILTRHLDKEARGFRLFTRPFRTLGARIFRRSNLKLNVRSPNSRYGSFHSNKPWSFTFLQTCSYPFVFIADSFRYDSRRFLQTFRSSQCDRFRRRMAVLYKFILRHCLRFFHEFSRRTNDFKTCSMRIWLMIRRSIHLKFKDKERVREKKRTLSSTTQTHWNKWRKRKRYYSDWNIQGFRMPNACSNSARFCWTLL